MQSMIIAAGLACTALPLGLLAQVQTGKLDTAKAAYASRAPAAPTGRAGQMTTPGTSGPVSISPSWAKRLEAMNAADGRKAFAIAREAAELPPDEGWAAARAAWTVLTNAESRKQFLKAFRIAEHPRLMPVLELGLLDPATPVREWAISYLKNVTLRDFSDDSPAGKAWLAARCNSNLVEVLKESARDAASQLKAGNADSARALLGIMRYPVLLSKHPEAVAGSGLEEALESVIAQGDQALVGEALRAAAGLPLSQPWYERVVIPRLQPEHNAQVRERAAVVLEQRGGEWAVKPLLTSLTNLLAAPPAEQFVLFPRFAAALGALGSAKSVPIMIGVIEANDTYHTVYGVGYFGLEKLTDVNYDASHNGAWWRAWWEKNKTRYPAEMQALPIPQLSSGRPKPAKMGGAAISAMSAEELDIPALECFAGGDTNKAYFLIGLTNQAAVPQDGFRLLLVMPGGNGGRGFHPFVKNIHRNALSKTYLTAQLVAPRWSEEQAQRQVWPIQKARCPEAQFCTEEFVNAVVADIQQRHKLNPQYIFTLSWSSSGPAAYAVSVAPESPVTGTFVGMSVFKPEELADLGAARGKAYYILHSPEDFISLRFPESARELLGRNGAVVKLATYPGGHGWHGDVMGNIVEGIRWLEAHASKPQP